METIKQIDTNRQRQTDMGTKTLIIIQKINIYKSTNTPTKRQAHTIRRTKTQNHYKMN